MTVPGYSTHHYHGNNITTNNSSNSNTLYDLVNQNRSSLQTLAIPDLTTVLPTVEREGSTEDVTPVYGPCKWLNGSTQGTNPWLMVSPLCSTRYQSVEVFTAVSVIMAAITLWTVLGNVLVLLALCRYTTLRTMSNCLIGNLAVSDLLLALTVLPISATNDLLGFWVFGEVMCTFWLCVDVLYCTASIWGLCTVAFDRYMATVYPVWYHDRRSVHKALACIVFVWIFSAVISLAPFIGWRHTLSNFFTFNTAMQRHECVLFTSSSYVLYSAMGSFVIPACLMAFMYIRIFVVLHGKSKGMAKKKLGTGGARQGQGRSPSTRLPNSNNNSHHQGSFSNGCGLTSPSDPSSPTLVTNGVERDFTTTTLVSVTLGSMCNLDNEENEEDQLESKTLLDAAPHPELSDHRLLQPLPKVDQTPSISLPQNLPAEQRRLLPAECETFLNTPDSVSAHSCRRSNSIALANTAAGAGLKPHNIQDLHIDLERRHSHNVAFTRSEPVGERVSQGTSRDTTTAKPGRLPGLYSNTQRSLSVNILSSHGGSDRSRQPAQRNRYGGALSFLSIPLLIPRRFSGYASAEPPSRLPDRNSRLTMSMKRRFELREQRATKRMLLIMASFCVCWMPFLVMYVLRGVCSSCHLDQHLVAAVIWLGYVNSSLNPVLYTLFNDDFKAAFKKMVGLGTSPRSGRKQGRGRRRARRPQI
ncbi:octopamine receptor 2 [Plakobranchus ocellatus]|uniref:Octopamine receptor 2 n=1 Tax=Plakobranchus ocellatus TaxID=259542 RepID=A0AAV3YMZ7_9GAST|nr:octopamine receptor 2 [Plakobranchus ocellatus]